MTAAAANTHMSGVFAKPVNLGALLPNMAVSTATNVWIIIRVTKS